MNVQEIKVKEETMSVDERLAKLQSDYEKLMKNYKKQQVELENERLKFIEASKIINTKQNLLKESDQQIDQLKREVIEADIKIKQLETVSDLAYIAKLEGEIKTLSIQLGVEKYKSEDVSKQLARREREAEEKDFNLGKLTARVEQMELENEKLKEDGKGKEYKLAPKVIDEDSKAKNLERNVVDELVNILIDGGPKQFFERIDYYFRTNKIVTDFKKVDQLINNVFYQKESCNNYRIAVEKIINEIESEESDWRTVMRVITKADDVVARKQKNITRIGQARKNLRDDEGYEQFINTFKKAKDVWEKELISNQIHLLSKNLTPEINKEFTKKVSVAIQEGQYEDKDIHYWLEEPEKIVKTQKFMEAFSSNISMIQKET
ncbi:hypothetical protein ACTA71_010918 [Dictyostelium dimigraforme]